MAYPQAANPFAAPAPGAAPAENPFAAPAPPNAPAQAVQTGNPFVPMAAAPAPTVSNPTEPGPSQTAQNPFGAPAAAAPSSQPQQAQNTAQQFAPPQPQNVQTQPGPAPPQQAAYPVIQPVAQQPVPQQTPAINPFQSNALVPSQQPANPYAGLVAPQQPQQPPGGIVANHALVPATQQGNQWSAGAPAGGASFDPFAKPPEPVPAPAPPPPPAPVQPLVQQQPVPQEEPFLQQQEQQKPESQQLVVSSFDQVPPPQYQLPPDAIPTDSRSVAPPVQDYHGGVSSGQSVASAPAGPAAHPTAMVPYEPESPADQPDEEENPARRIAASPQTQYGRALARNAPPDAAPLPRAELVRKSGYVLARISFRTIVMKKWKQAFWVQYGPHTMIWFRSQSDFSDWLNNPYHTQAQRNFLIKLAVNFVHDLYRPNVRGYQVTQSRTKSYGRHVMKQFKLERWMDYGPTIAAAFASRDHKEVDALREAIVECMRNTPQDSGIRATGAVRQNPHQQQNGHNGHSDAHNYQYNSQRDQGAPPDSYDDTSFTESYGASQDFSSRHLDERRRSESEHVGAPAPAPMADLLDFTEETPASAPTPAPGAAHPGSYQPAGAPQPSAQPAAYGAPAPYGAPQQAAPPAAQYGAPPQQTAPPAAQYGAPPQQTAPPAAQHGAPPQQNAQYGAPPQQTAAPPAAQYGAPPQQAPYGTQQPAQNAYPQPLYQQP